ncbi:MAG: hypothetical protein ACP5OO_08105 [Chloroflexia bacterium]
MSGYCLAHGLITLHLDTEEGRRALPAALFEHSIGVEALERAGPRVRRVARWDAAGWEVWWEILARLAGGRPVLAALPLLEEAPEVPSAFPSVHVVPPVVAVCAGSPIPEGIALYLGAFAWEAAPFGPAGMAEPRSFPPGLELLYRLLIAEAFRRERRVLLPVQVPVLLAEGRPADVAPLLENVVPHLSRPAVLGGEDEAVVVAVADALRRRGHEVWVVDPLHGLERLVWAIGGLP